MRATITPLAIPGAVKLRFGGDREQVLAQGISLESGQVAVQLPLRHMRDWLTENQFRYVHGTNGIWMRLS